MADNFREALQKKLESLTKDLRFWNEGAGEKTAPSIVCTAYAPTSSAIKLGREVPYCTFSVVHSIVSRRGRSKRVKLHLLLEADPSLNEQEGWDGGHDNIEEFVEAIQDHLYDKPQKYAGLKLSNENGIDAYIGSRDKHQEGMPAYPYFFAEIELLFVQQ